MVLEVLSTLHPELHVWGRKPGSILWLTFSSCRDIRSSQASEETPVPNPGDSAVFALFFLLTWKHLTWSETSKGYFLLYFPSLHSNACAPPPAPAPACPVPVEMRLSPALSILFSFAFVMKPSGNYAITKMSYKSSPALPKCGAASPALFKSSTKQEIISQALLVIKHIRWTLNKLQSCMILKVDRQVSTTWHPASVPFLSPSAYLL